ncbi:MAG: tRNA (adenosine(37)-N6)-threonylcarbamoyltransferase complex transferase subunit TsaD [Candidatus Saccharibacteria bacterium]|nr:tRNA (adenosine(37)-N6)-threonylcarbamoyltransferase complex transferase subunit TsaD [Candidatus Saccharibacteria bacterium]
MKILGIETSCDETGIAVVENGQRLLGHVVLSQIDIHQAFGGIVPEVAARSHLEAIIPICQQALDEAHLTWAEIDGIGVTYGAGLAGSLLVGVLTAQVLAVTKNKPLYACNHVEGHVYANFLTDSEKYSVCEALPKFPLLALIISGKHSQLVLFENHFKYQLLGQTIDDAVGEAFDKVARLLGLPYPGGPSIAQLALRGDVQAFDFPDAKLQNQYDFSFSGLKTAVLRQAQLLAGGDYSLSSLEVAKHLDLSTRANLAASFQRAAVTTLVDKTIKAYQEFKPHSVVIAGGVACNQELRRILKHQLPINIIYAPAHLCTDNGAMIACLACYQVMENLKPINPFEITIDPSLSM